jgi:hypothetical protein
LSIPVSPPFSAAHFLGAASGQIPAPGTFAPSAFPSPPKKSSDTPPKLEHFRCRRARAMNVHLFQKFLELNHSFDNLVAGLKDVESVPFFQRDLIRHALSDVEIARVYANREFFDNFGKILEDDARWAYRFQRNFTEKLKDRDDIYLEVSHAEGRRKRKGLPPRVIILPDWDMSDEDRYDEEQARRRTKLAAKKGRKARTTDTPAAAPTKGVRS